MSRTVAEQVATLMVREAGTAPLPLKTIYSKARKSWRWSRTSLESTIRAQIQRHSSSSAQFLGGENMFRRHSEGVWAVRADYARKVQQGLVAA